MFVCALRRVASCGERSHVGMFLRGWARFAHAPVQTLQESEQGALHASCVAAQHSLLVVAPQPWPAAAPSPSLFTFLCRSVRCSCLLVVLPGACLTAQRIHFVVGTRCLLFSPREQERLNGTGIPTGHTAPAGKTGKVQKETSKVQNETSFKVACTLRGTANRNRTDGTGRGNERCVGGRPARAACR